MKLLDEKTIGNITWNYLPEHSVEATELQTNVLFILKRKEVWNRRGRIKYRGLYGQLEKNLRRLAIYETLRN